VASERGRSSRWVEAVDQDRRVEHIYRTWHTVADIEATAQSGDGYVVATVDAGGYLRHLRLDPRIYRSIDPSALAEQITGTIAEASRLARLRAFDAIAAALPINAVPDTTDLALDLFWEELDRR